MVFVEYLDHITFEQSVINAQKLYQMINYQTSVLVCDGCRFLGTKLLSDRLSQQTDPAVIRAHILISWRGIIRKICDTPHTELYGIENKFPSWDIFVILFSMLMPQFHMLVDHGMNSSYDYTYGIAWWVNIQKEKNSYDITTPISKTVKFTVTSGLG